MDLTKLMGRGSTLFSGCLFWVSKSGVQPSLPVPEKKKDQMLEHVSEQKNGALNTLCWSLRCTHSPQHRLRSGRRLWLPPPPRPAAAILGAGSRRCGRGHARRVTSRRGSPRPAAQRRAGWWRHSAATPCSRWGGRERPGTVPGDRWRPLATVGGRWRPGEGGRGEKGSEAGGTCRVRGWFPQEPSRAHA